MSKASMTIEGFVAKTPELGNHQGRAVTNVSVPHTPRRLNKQTNQWEDAGPTLWVQASFWEAEAEAIVANVTKGTLVTITGQPELRVFTKQDGSTDAALTIRFGTLGIIPRATQPAPATTDAWNTPGVESFGDTSPF